ncbi:unnamed protein product [Psylliodes chrysocephalus]|uniref:Uncharacterized protein n=1 Tax=Psylliodes chrysocephalus TaxID=3402493 RepID=A0A9P0DCI3_9CUCU|nr:unnamed protein product [Psylliodes chrysocephala]
MHQCTLVLIKFSEYALTKLSISYISSGKLQTDNLERRFGEYRGLSGCNYNVSFRHVLESEKKIRINKLFHYIKDNNLPLTLNNTKHSSEQAEHNYTCLFFHRFVATVAALNVLRWIRYIFG